MAAIAWAESGCHCNRGFCEAHAFPTVVTEAMTAAASTHRLSTGRSCLFIRGACDAKCDSIRKAMAGAARSRNGGTFRDDASANGSRTSAPITIVVPRPSRAESELRPLAGAVLPAFLVLVVPSSVLARPQRWRLTKVATVRTARAADNNQNGSRASSSKVGARHSSTWYCRRRD